MSRRVALSPSPKSQRQIMQLRLVLPLFLVTPAVGALGALCAERISWPLPWMVGSMVMVIIVRCSGWNLRDVPNGRRVGQWLIASVIGMHFSAAVLSEVSNHFLMMLIAALLTLLTALIGIALINRSGVDLPTSFFSLMPANSAEMIILGERYQADRARVAAAHSLRLVLIVLVIPAAVTWGLGTGTRSMPALADWSWLAIMLPTGFAVAWGRAFMDSHPVDSRFVNASSQAVRHLFQFRIWDFSQTEDLHDSLTCRR
ncbi:AbrB family transcriptional regulator [Pseudomonas juntendi]|uniref:AbrB family transcriptional regulator n=1 Tax=Pseudomonas juntendi TaxID=2666183 RepID=UPI003C7C593D